MAAKQINIAGSFIGSPSEIQEVLEFASKHNVRACANELPMDQMNEAIKFVRQGHPRYRAVFMN
jgi:D-arabinose 1-dehydrogenase-like Zn-dependent alcohol dehydrogenase